MKQKLSAKAGVNEYLTQLSASELSQMSKWGFLKNVININTFFATSKDVKQAAKAGIKVDASGVKTSKQDKDDDKEEESSKEKEDDSNSADKADKEDSDLFNKKKSAKKAKVTQQKQTINKLES